MDARQAVAESLAVELGVDLAPAFFEIVDRLLVQMYLRGYVVREKKKEKRRVKAHEMRERK